MSLVTSKEMLRAAQAGGWAVGAFNVENMELVQAVLAAAEELRAPVILQTTPSTLRYADAALYAAMIRAAAERATVPICVHLDHGNSLELAVQAVKSGYTSVMIDGSRESFADNVALTRSVVKAVAALGIPVEAELGSVGGKEDEVVAAGGYTRPEEAAAFVAETEVASLAVAIGTAHGFYAGTPVLDVSLLREIRKLVTVPLVLHGASGLSDESVQACVKEGVCKVNFATELRVAYTAAVRRVLADETVFDPKAYGRAGAAAVTELVKNRMRVCGCVGKA